MDKICSLTPFATILAEAIERYLVQQLQFTSSGSETLTKNQTNFAPSLLVRTRLFHAVVVV